MRTIISTRLNCTPEQAWDAMQSPRLLLFIAAPLLTFDPIQPSELPEKWQPGDYLVRMRFLGVLPLGSQWIGIRVPEIQESGRYAIRDAGRGTLVKKWDHLIMLSPAEDGTTIYTDQVDIDAGLLTRFIWLFSQVFYRYRQSRWRMLVNQNFSFG